MPLIHLPQPLNTQRDTDTRSLFAHLVDRLAIFS